MASYSLDSGADFADFRHPLCAIIFALMRHCHGVKALIHLKSL